MKARCRSTAALALLPGVLAVPATNDLFLGGGLTILSKNLLDGEGEASIHVIDLCDDD